MQLNISISGLNEMHIQSHTARLMVSLEVCPCMTSKKVRQVLTLHFLNITE